MSKLVEFNGKKYGLWCDGYYHCTTGDQEFLHRDVYESYFGPIPEGYVVHHEDYKVNGKLNNDPSNLTLMLRADHNNLHAKDEEKNTRISESMAGVLPSELTRSRMSAARAGKPSPNKGRPAHNKGKSMSEEQKEKLSKAMIKRYKEVA
jgi:hypothetical protein